MAQFKIRAASIFADGKKIGQAFESTLTIEGGDEALFGDADGQFLGYSDGAITTKLESQMVLPVAGLDVDLHTALLQKRNLDIVMNIGPQLASISMRPLSVADKGEMKSGTETSSWSFGGGKPVIQ